MRNVFDVLTERGSIAQTSHEEALRDFLGGGQVTFYVGFDATAPSLHVGHFATLVAMARMQQHGHRPIALIGGGTTMVGDPTGKTDMRPMLTPEEIAFNAERFRTQLSKFLEFGEGKAVLVNNAEWLLELKYVEMLREIGAHFSVNRMLTAECFKARLERGLSFLEFNYMLMQSYDFLELYRRFECRLQVGGDDQWSNILAGADLIRRKESAEAYALTLTLLTTSTGKKMGKTEAGAVWLDPAMTSPYDFYQYFRNLPDADVPQRLALLTFLPMDEVRRLAALEGHEINEAKKVLAYEVTKLVHGEAEAKKAQEAAEALFGGGGDNKTAMPTTEVSASQIAAGMRIVELLTATGLASSNSQGRRLIDQGGVYLNDEKITSVDTLVDLSSFTDGQLMLRKGKKVYHQVVLGK